jgi:hypothetical protein
VFSFFDSASAKAFGNEIAGDFIKVMPPDTELKEPQFEKKAQQCLGGMTYKITHYKNNNKLNTYKIAQMANSFKWKLRDAGYQPKFIDSLTQWLILNMKI